MGTFGSASFWKQPLHRKFWTQPGATLQETFMPKIEIPGTPPAPKVEDKAVQEAAAEAARRRQRSRGVRSTILGSMLEGSAALKQTMGS